MKQAGMESSERRWMELREILNRWDPIGVFGYESVEWPEDEYESYVDPLMWQLRAGKSEEQITQYLESLVHDWMEIEVEPGKAESCAKEAFEWFHRRHIH
jgi:hypothetical protein